MHGIELWKCEYFAVLKAPAVGGVRRWVFLS
jgi:hypothetical protein